MNDATRGPAGVRENHPRVKNASNPQTFRDLDEHRGVLDIDYLPGWGLRNIQRKPEDVRAGLADVDEAG